MENPVTTQTDTSDAPAAEVATRHGWLRVLSEADTADLKAAWHGWDAKPEVQQIRGPEAGLVMVRGRADASGAKFNLGEATVSRATVRLHGGPLEDDVLGSSYVLGTDLEHALLAAVFDGLLSDLGLRDKALAEVISPLAQSQAKRDEGRRAEAHSTLVDFFTVAREHA
jgi:alpha-D-ribose 1-methylphosphonate 5-triphosphate synthase subunit PhnG